jgi:capsular exopolysaccharide synthesis family protein
MKRMSRKTTPMQDSSARSWPQSAAAAVAPARSEPMLPARQVDLDPGCADPRLVALTRESIPAAHEYDQLAVRLLLGAAERPLRRLMIVSAGRGDGRTTVALNLASSLARAGRRVLLVDADLANPSAARKLGFETEVGLAEAVVGGLGLEDAVVRVNPYGFDLIAVRDRVDPPTEVLASPALEALLAEAERQYDFVIVDTPPLADEAAMSLLVRMASATLLVVRAGATSATEMARAIGTLTQDLVFGVVLNRAARR